MRSSASSVPGRAPITKLLKPAARLIGGCVELFGRCRICPRRTQCLPSSAPLLWRSTRLRKRRARVQLTTRSLLRQRLVALCRRQTAPRRGLLSRLAILVCHSRKPTSSGSAPRSCAPRQWSRLRGHHQRNGFRLWLSMTSRPNRRASRRAWLLLRDLATAQAHRNNVLYRDNPIFASSSRSGEAAINRLSHFLHCTRQFCTDLWKAVLSLIIFLENSRPHFAVEVDAWLLAPSPMCVRET